MDYGILWTIIDGFPIKAMFSSCLRPKGTIHVYTLEFNDAPENCVQTRSYDFSLKKMTFLLRKKSKNCQFCSARNLCWLMVSAGFLLRNIFGIIP